MVIIEGRYNGPADSGNGGWTAGTVAAELRAAGGAVVTLRIPPPLDTPMSVIREAGTIRVYAPDGTLVADAAPTEVAPVDDGDGSLAPVSFADAVAAGAAFPGLVSHPFPTCFVCGPERAVGDGMRLFPGRLDDGRTAAAWCVPADVSPAMVWAALDCPGGWSVGIEGRPFLLGRIAVRVDAVPAPGDECVVIGRLLDAEGRKAHVATVLYGPDGGALATARATWIALA